MEKDYLPNHIYLVDAYEAMGRLAHQSVDLVLTDPVYSEGDDYVELSRLAAWFLKPGGSVLAFASTGRIPDLVPRMGRYLKYHWTLNYVIKAKTTRLLYQNIFTWNTPVLWFAKGSTKPHTRIPDTYIGDNGPAHGKHRWNKNLGVLEYWINAFTEPGDVVLDPYCGDGSVLVACKRTGRRWIGFDVDANSVTEARERVARAQPPLFTSGREGYQLALGGQDDG